MLFDPQNSRFFGFFSYYFCLLARFEFLCVCVCVCVCVRVYHILFYHQRLNYTKRLNFSPN